MPKENNWYYALVCIWKKPSKAEAKRLKIPQEEYMTVDSWAGPFSQAEAKNLAEWEIGETMCFCKMITPLYYQGKKPPELKSN